MKDERTLADRLEEAIKASRELAMPQVALSMTDAFTVLQALRSQPSVEGWRPIETAPKDGTLIMTWCVHANAEFCDDAVAEGYAGPVIAKWIDHHGGGFTWHGLAGTHTHWQPLPAAPDARQINSMYEGGDE